MPENVKFNIHCIYSLFEKCRPYVLISDVMASIRKEKIPKRWYTRPCRTECKTGTEKPGWPVWTGWPGWLCLMMGGGVLIKICSKAVRSNLHFWWSWWWWWRWQWWRTLSHIDAQKPIYGIKYLWEFGCTPKWWWWWWWWWWWKWWWWREVAKLTTAQFGWAQQIQTCHRPALQRGSCAQQDKNFFRNQFLGGTYLIAWWGGRGVFPNDDDMTKQLKENRKNS